MRIEWEIIKHRGLGVVGYNYPATLTSWNKLLPDAVGVIIGIRNWIREDSIEAIESSHDYTWYFKNESDRTILLLKWTEC